MHRRYGLDMDNLGADDASVAEALAKVERDRERAELERRTGRDETAEAVQLMAAADREDRDRHQDADEENQRPEALAEEAGPKCDSAERRRKLAASKAYPNREAVQPRLSADQDHAAPPIAAVTKAPREPEGRKTGGANGQTKLLQKGMSGRDGPRDLAGSVRQGWRCADNVVRLVP